MSPPLRRLLSLLLVFVAAFAAVTALRVWQSGGGWRDVLPLFGGQREPFEPENFTLSERPPLDIGDVELLARLNDEYARMTRAVVPSVVSIDTAGVRTERMHDIWGRARIRRYPTQGQGSGVIVTHEGHVVTNHHVIAGQQQIRVTLHGGESHAATLIGQDHLLDIAVLKIEGSGPFQPLKLGDSSQVEVGQLVFAVGNPFGLGETVTQGIISAKERSLSDNQRDLFQTDAAINPGNSGGPLVNLRGEIIGINVAIFSSDRDNPGFMGVGFSIPSNDVRDALYQILERGRPQRGFLGVQMRDLDDAVRSAIGYEGRRGAVVLGVVPGSPALRSGLQPWDVILSYNGEEIRGTSQLISLVQRTRVGSVVAMRVWRGGELIELEATIIESNEGTMGMAAAGGGGGEGGQELAGDARALIEAVGVGVRELSPEERLGGLRGVRVSGVVGGTPADGLFSPGDLLLAVNGVQVGSAREFYSQLVASAGQHETVVHLMRGNQPVRVVVPAVGGVD